MNLPEVMSKSGADRERVTKPLADTVSAESDSGDELPSTQLDRDRNRGGGGGTKPAAAAREQLRLNPAATSLLVVDAQRGFTELCPGELPVPGGAAIVPAVNALLDLPFARVDATQDWHPPDHRSFHGRADGFYPPHCVAGTPGAEFLPGLHAHRFHAVWRKGYHQDFEAYAVTAQHPAFAAFLRASGITAVVVCGLATNICCFYAARDLRREGFAVWLAEDAGAGIDVPAAGLFQAAAKAEGQSLGIRYVTVAEVRKALA